jgi:hypothetical protein
MSKLEAYIDARQLSAIDGVGGRDDFTRILMRVSKAG